MSKIKKIEAYQIIDSRGNPTIETVTYLTDGISARAAVPSGASTGKFEALELRDGDKSRFHGKEVQKAVKNVNEKIFNELKDRDPTDQKKIDWLMRELDGSRDKSNLGANAILSVSLSVSRAAAKLTGKKLYEYLAQTYDFSSKSFSLPTPQFNVLNGGQHAQNELAIQEFLIIPVGVDGFFEKLRLGCEVYYELKGILNDKGYSTGVGDEGGFAPDVNDPKEALSLLLEAGQKAGYTKGDDFVLGLDVAASEFSQKENDKFSYQVTSDNTLDSKRLTNYLLELADEFYIGSIEDPLDQEDWQGWQYFSKKAGDDIQVVGDDLFVTNQKRLKKGIDMNIANAILIKLNQIGTLTETIETIKLAQKHNYRVVVSHRSGETTDPYIADLAVATSSQQLKSGSLARGERLAKYNRTLRIARWLKG